MNTIIEDHQPQFDKALDHLREEMSAIRTGRATPALIEGALIEAYGTKTPLLQLATITTPDSRSLMVEPWDKSIIKEIEKSLSNANLGLSVANEGKHLRLVIASLTEETRRDLIKNLNQKAENTRRILRGFRDDIKEQIQKAEKNKEIGEDDRYKMQKELDEFTGNYNNKIKEMVDRKEKEIMTI